MDRLKSHRLRMGIVDNGAYDGNVRRSIAVLICSTKKELRGG